MNLLNKLTIKNLKLNKKRTIVTIIGIILSVALIAAVSTMYSSAIKSLIKYETYHNGYFHVAYYDVPISEVDNIKNNRGVKDTYLTSNIGYAKLSESKNTYKPYAFIKGFTKESLKNLSVKLIDGRLPENENEIVIPSHLKTNGRVDLKVGESIALDVGVRVSDGYQLGQDSPYHTDVPEDITNTKKHTYKIVGIIERPATNIESYDAPGYTFITTLDKKNMSDKVDVYAKYNKKGSKNYLTVTSNILQINESSMKKFFKDNFSELEQDEQNKIIKELDKAKYEYNINSYLITLENNPLDHELGVIAGIVCIIIVVTSVFCIKNSFDISITEKIKQYGMLRSIGATKRQIKKNVFYEATILGLIGIPLGILFGFIASYILIIVSNLLLNGVINNGLKLYLSYSWISVVVAIVLGVVTIYLSALKSARNASKVSAIESIRNSANIKIKAKNVKSPKIIKKIFGVGGDISYKNIKRNKKKYRTTTISIIVSVAIFIGLSYFMNSAFNMVKSEITTYDYNIVLSINGISSNKTLQEKAFDTLILNNIQDYSVVKKKDIYIKSPKYTKEYIEYGNFSEDFINNDGYINIISIGDYQFKKYIKELNLNYNDCIDKAILVSKKVKFQVLDKKTGKIKDKYAIKFNYKDGDILNLSHSGKENINIPIIHTTDKLPFGSFNSSSFIVVSNQIFNKIFPQNDNLSIYYKSNNPNKLQDDIDTIMDKEEYSLNNIEERARLMNNLYTLVAIFLYGFIIVITLIGVTNIFNTITTNMNLRKQEFAMLKSIGMTNKEFNRMIGLESIFIGAKSLIFGITIGILISYLIYIFMEFDNGLKFNIPIFAILISVVAVYLLITILMKYSMNKINKENTIETIRNENI